MTGRHYLSNGLEVRLLPRQATSLVATLVLVKTGYALEEPANLGYSHLLEHLIFAGTEEMDKNKLFEKVESMGGYFNGYTRDDYMGYILVGHREHFERQMGLLAAVLFQAAVKDEAVAAAKEVVLEEIRRRQSRPDTRAYETFQSLLYEGSSYARTGLGNERTVSGASREEILEHYRRVYRPDNMILLAAGGLKEQSALQVLERTFGAVEPGARPGRADPPPPLVGRRVYTLETEIPDLRVQIGFNGPDPREETSEGLELLAALLGGRGGRLEKALEADGFSPRSVRAGLAVNAGFSRFTVTAGLPAGTEAVRALYSLLGAIRSLSHDGPSAEEIFQARDALVADEIMGREKLHYYLMGKAPWVLAGSPGQGFSEKRWGDVGVGELRRIAAKYLADSPYVALLSSPATAEEKETGKQAPPRMRAVLDNGLVIVAEERPGSRVFALNLMTRRRSAAEPAGKAGLVDFLHRMLPKGTKTMSGEEIEARIRDIGASLTTAGDPTVPFGDFYTSRSYSFVRLECLQEKAGEAVGLVADLVSNAAFPETEIEKVKGEMVDYISYRDARPGSLAGRLLAGRLYGPGPFGSDVMGEAGSIGSVTREDLLRFRENYFTGENVILSVVSGLSPQEAAGLLKEHFSRLPAGGGLPEIRLGGATTLSPLERELGKQQGALAAGAIVGFVPPEKRAALAVVAGILNDRLQRQLREKEGLAYSVGASLGTVEGTGVLSVSMGTSQAKIEQAREGVRREVEAVRLMEVDGEEIERRVNAITGRLQMRMLSSLNRGFYLALAEKKGVPHTFDEDYRRILLDLTPGEVEEAAKSYLPEVLTEVIVR